MYVLQFHWAINWKGISINYNFNLGLIWEESNRVHLRTKWHEEYFDKEEIGDKLKRTQ
jgi:hypothetical protein